MKSLSFSNLPISKLSARQSNLKTQEQVNQKSFILKKGPRLIASTERERYVLAQSTKREKRVKYS